MAPTTSTTVTSTSSANNPGPTPYVQNTFSGNDFSNNLFTDLAPLLTLFGEAVTKQFLSQATGWADNVLGAMGAIGVLTIVVSAIRVGGNRHLKALVGRARETRAEAELELLTSVSEEVCEMYNGKEIVRIRGNGLFDQFILYETPLDRKIYISTLEDSYREKTYPSTDLPRGKKIMPNLTLNLRHRSGSRMRLETIAAATIGVILQLIVITVSAMITFKWHWQGFHSKYGFECFASGTVTMSLGLILSSHIVESMTEELWLSAKWRYNIQTLILQGKCRVDDQHFSSCIMIYPEMQVPQASFYKPRMDHARHRFLPSRNILTIVATLLSLSGYTAQFVGIRALHWSVSLLQLGISIFMTGIRSYVRRDLGEDISDFCLEFTGDSSCYTLGWAALLMHNRILEAREQIIRQPSRSMTTRLALLDLASNGCGTKFDPRNIQLGVTSIRSGKRTALPATSSLYGTYAQLLNKRTTPSNDENDLCPYGEELAEAISLTLEVLFQAASTNTLMWKDEFVRSMSQSQYLGWFFPVVVQRDIDAVHVPEDISICIKRAEGGQSMTLKDELSIILSMLYISYCQKQDDCRSFSPGHLDKYRSVHSTWIIGLSPRMAILQKFLPRADRLDIEQVRLADKIILGAHLVDLEDINTQRTSTFTKDENLRVENLAPTDTTKVHMSNSSDVSDTGSHNLPFASSSKSPDIELQCLSSGSQSPGRNPESPSASKLESGSAEEPVAEADRTISLIGFRTFELLKNIYPCELFTTFMVAILRNVKSIEPGLDPTKPGCAKLVQDLVSVVIKAKLSTPNTFSDLSQMDRALRLVIPAMVKYDLLDESIDPSCFKNPRDFVGGIITYPPRPSPARAAPDAGTGATPHATTSSAGSSNAPVVQHNSNNAIHQSSE